MEQLQKKMSSRFARSLSFPVPAAAAAGSQFLAVKIRSASAALAASYQQRSVSLPARLHPIVAQIEDEIRSLRSWQNSALPSSPAGSPAWIVAGLAGIDDIHSSLADLLQHPQLHDAPHLRRSIWADRLLDDSLFFADAHSGFRSAILALTDHLSAARSALRRRDEPALAAALRAQKRTEKELLKLAASVRGIGRAGLVEAELGGIAREVTAVTAAASAAVFSGMAMLASAATAGVSTGSSHPCVVGALVWRSAAFKKRMEIEGETSREMVMRRMEAVEKCISALESRNQRVLRRMLNTRVFLLNAQTPAL